VALVGGAFVGVDRDAEGVEGRARGVFAVDVDRSEVGAWVAPLLLLHPAVKAARAPRQATRAMPR